MPLHAGFIASPDTLLMDRFVWTRDLGWIDLATDRRVALVNHDASDVGTRAWLTRCSRLSALWCSHLAPMLDYDLVGERRLEVHPWTVDAPEPASAAAIVAGIAACLRARGLCIGPADDVRWTHDGTSARLVAGPRMGLLVEDVAREYGDDSVTSRVSQLKHACCGSRKSEASSRSSRPPAHVRVMALDLTPRAALGAIETALDEAACGPIAIPLSAARGAGLTTLLAAVARAARLRGVVPICPQSLARIEGAVRLRGRTSVLLVDDSAPRVSIAAALATARRQAITVAAVVGRAVGDREDPAIELGRLSFDRLARSATFAPPLDVAVRTALLRTSEGAPGRLVAAWRSTNTYRRPRLPDASGWAEGAPVPSGASRACCVAEDRAAWGSPQAHVGWRALDAARIAEARRQFEATLAGERAGELLVESLWGLGVCALEAARLEEGEQWLRSAYCALAESGDSREPLTRGVRLSLARCLLWQGRVDEAAAMLECVSRIVEGDVALLRLQAQVERARGDGHAALRTLSQAVRACRTPAERAAVHADCADAQALAGDHLAAAAHLRAALTACREAPTRYLVLRLRALALETHARARGTGEARPLPAWRVSRTARRLSRGDVPPLVRLRVSRVLEALGQRRTREVQEFVQRWGEDVLWPSLARAASTGERVMVSDLQAVLEICRDADEGAAALDRVCHCLRQRLHAAAVAIHVGAGEARRLTLAGSPRLATLPLALRVIDSGLAASIATGDAGAEAGAPIAYGGQTIGAIVGRWPLAAPVEPRVIDALLAAAATAVAPHLQSTLDRDRVHDQMSERELGFLGASASLAALRDRVRRAALAPFHVLIEGESGSGKEVVARAIHTAGPRRRKRFCALNCAALTDELLETELFGHARGAFTGAVGERPGLFEEADGGTLFLDEVGELSTRAQAKLLRVIQEGEVRRVGENQSRRIDARLVAATNRSLRDEVGEGRFRADLLYRLDVVHISVPPLRERPEDIALLARAFWREATTRMASRATLHPSTVAALARYHWPGNVRELQNVVSALAVNAPLRGAVTAARLPGAIAAQADAAARLTLDAARRSFEERFVRSALARAGNQPGRAARDLGVTRQGLRKLLVRLRIELSGDGLDIRTDTEAD